MLVGVGNVGRVGGQRRVAPSEPDFALSASSVATVWGEVVVGDLLPLNAPAGVSFVLVDETAGLAVVNG